MNGDSCIRDVTKTEHWLRDPDTLVNFIQGCTRDEDCIVTAGLQSADILAGCFHGEKQVPTLVHELYSLYHSMLEQGRSVETFRESPTVTSFFASADNPQNWTCDTSFVTIDTPMCMCSLSLHLTGSNCATTEPLGYLLLALRIVSILFCMGMTIYTIRVALQIKRARKSGLGWYRIVTVLAGLITSWANISLHSVFILMRRGVIYQSSALTVIGQIIVVLSVNSTLWVLYAESMKLIDMVPFSERSLKGEHFQYLYRRLLNGKKGIRALGIVMLLIQILLVGYIGDLTATSYIVPLQVILFLVIFCSYVIGPKVLRRYVAKFDMKTDVLESQNSSLNESLNLIYKQAKQVSILLAVFLTLTSIQTVAELLFKRATQFILIPLGLTATLFPALVITHWRVGLSIAKVKPCTETCHETPSSVGTLTS